MRVERKLKLMCDVAALKYAAVFRRSTHNDSLITTAKNGVCSRGSQTSTLPGAIANFSAGRLDIQISRLSFWLHPS